uniref:T-complex protein 11-like protein 1 n=1 Tax=Acanthochromis polyacanthus TaxID=80966 RepID=A0A3Q1GMA4_9TELE
LSSLMELENCVSNLSLAHEILVNRDFCFKPRSPPTGSLEGRVTEVVHRAFWDSLQEQLSSDPPNYSHATILLQEVKTMLQSLLMPGHVQLRSQLDEVLDMELIQQEVDHGALDLHRLAGFIINTMASLCAPVRDPEVRALRDLKEPVELLREIFQVLGLMKTDMVNFTIQSLRPHLMQQAVQYERAKFQQILENQPGEEGFNSRVLQSPTFLTASAFTVQSDSSGPDSRGPLSATAVLNRAYMHLLHWDPQDQKYPETVLMDQARLDALGQRLQMLVLEASVLLLTNAQCGGVVFTLQGFVGKLRQSEDVVKHVLAVMGNRYFWVIFVHVDAFKLGCVLVQSADFSPSLSSSNIGERVQGFLRAMLQGGPAKRSPELSAPLRLVSAELAELGTAFGRIVHFNRTVFGPFYAPILRKLLFPPGEAEAEEDSR